MKSDKLLSKAELLELMEDTNNYFFKVSNRTNGFLYILDGNGSRVMIHGKVKRFKTTTRAAQFVYELEYRRNLSL